MDNSIENINSESDAPYVAWFQLFVFFPAIILSSFLAGYYIPDNLDLLFREMTASGALLLSQYLGLNSFPETAIMIVIEGKRLSIISECTAVNYILIYSAAIIAFPSASSRKKFFGVLIGVPAIIFVNLARITFLGWLGGHHQTWFNLFHVYLWEGGFVLVVVSLWITWFHSPFEIKGHLLRAKRNNVLAMPLMACLVLIILSLSLLFLLSGIYQHFIALGADRFVHLLGFEEGSIRAKGIRLMVIFSLKSYKEIWAGIYYLLPFIVLILFFPAIGIKNKIKHEVSFSEIIIKLTVGLLVLTLIQLLSVALFFILISQGGADWQMALVDTAARFSSVIVWLFLAMGSLGFNSKDSKGPPSKQRGDSCHCRLRALEDEEVTS